MSHDATTLIQLPSLLDSLDGSRTTRGSIRVLPAGKPPKLRFQPGNIILVRGQHYEVICAYRTAGRPHEWCFYLEERTDAEEPKLSAVSRAVFALGAGVDTKLVVKEIFLSSYDVLTYFADVPKITDWQGRSNSSLLRDGASLVSSGPVLGPTS